MDDRDDAGGTFPTPQRKATAIRLREMHQRVCVPEPACNFCLRPWPCPDVRWSQLVLDRAAAEEPAPRP